MDRFPTRCVHAGTIADGVHMGINSPIYTSTSFGYIDQPDTIYPRYLNTPNEKAVAEKIASLENTDSALVFSSGMAAISAVLFSFLGKGDHAVFQKGLYGGTTHFLEREFERFGIECTIASSQLAVDLESCIRENTRLVYIETPSNPLLRITDILAVARMAKKRGLISVIDNTFASPVNQQPAGLGIDLVVHSATKYMGGHSDIQAGAVAGREDLMKQVHQTGLNFGGSLNAITLYLLERSLKTMYLRVERINENAMKLAHFLEAHQAVSQVNYPGLSGHPGHEIAARQMTGFGGMLSFEVSGKDGTGYQKRLKLIKPSISLGGLESICSSPAHTSHRHLGPEGRKEEGISEELIRLSVGIEDVEDLKADLEQALK
ncbi:MAG: aminotransferase class I/II-fold pyridoxal phosphate-dependent enzyme [Bacteroidales bacterium]|nr:aminotransferase class I/II-fold pyridoxal phosphate-dependent enzyme [Bacteroidales bacterium]